MSALKKAVPFLILGGVAAMVGGGVFAYNRAEAKQKEQRDQAFTDLSQCLMGDIIASGDDTLNRIAKIQNRIVIGSAEAGTDDGKLWPQRCGTITRDMSDSVRTSSFLDEGAKRDLLKELERLQKDLELPDAATTDLGLPILALWRAAEKHKVQVTKSSNVSGPSTVPSLENAEKAVMPFTSIEPIPNGPQWAYLVSGAGSSKDYVCSLLGDELACKGFEHEGSLDPVGTWSNTKGIPFTNGQGAVFLFDGEKLTPVETKFSGVTPRLHVSDNGTVYMVGTAFVGNEVKQLLAVRTADGKTKSVPLEKALERASEGAGADAITATILAENVLIRRTAEDGIKGELQLFAISEDAKLTEAGKMPAQGSVDMVPSVCRTNGGFALDLSVRQTTLMFFEKGKWSGPLTSARRGLGCSPAGVWVGKQEEVCSSSGCREVLSSEEIESFKKLSGGNPRSMKFGDKLLLSWYARGGSGVMVRVSPADGKGPASEVFISETSDNAGAPVVYGDGNGALVFGKLGSDNKLAGVRVAADGSVAPLAVSMK
jgi:hypothetical protein